MIISQMLKVLLALANAPTQQNMIMAGKSMR